MKKKCKKCGIEKELTVENFERQKGMKDGFRNTCRECRNKRSRELYKPTGKVKKWTNEEKMILIEYYPKVSNKELSEKYLPNRSVSQIQDYATKTMGLHKDKEHFKEITKQKRELERQLKEEENRLKEWSDEDIKLLIEVYPNMSNEDIKNIYFPNRSLNSINYKVRKLGLYKSEEYMFDLRTSKLEKVNLNKPKKEKVKKERVKKEKPKKEKVKIKKDKIKKDKSDKPNKSENKRAKWSEEEELLLKQVYGNHSNEDIKELYFPDKTLNMINARARKLGLYKSEEYMFDLRMSNLEKAYSNQPKKEKAKKEKPKNVKNNNPKQSRVIVYCSECGKEIEVIPSKLKTQKRFYCSKECLRLGRQKFNSGENNPNYNNGKVWTKEMREEASKRAVKRLNERNFNFINTKPQIIINEVLDKKSISFENEYDCVLYSIDNYLTDCNLMIEVQGNFFHCNPTMNLSNSRKEEILKKDKTKHKYIKEVYDIEILYLWEKDIIEDIEKCEHIIVEYIKNNGILQNYHSYNYEIVNGTLQLKEELTDIGY